MAVEESERHLLHQQAARAMGPEAAAILMSHLPPAGWADLARRADVEHETAMLRADLGHSTELLRAEMGSLRSELTAEMGSLRSELTAEIATVHSELTAKVGSVSADIDKLRAELSTALEAGLSRNLRWVVGLFAVMGTWMTAVQTFGS